MKINLIRNLHNDEEIMDALPVEVEEMGPARTEAIQTIWGLFEVLLKAPGRLDAFVREPKLQGKLISGFAVIVILGFALYGLAVSLVLCAFPAEAVPGLLFPGWVGNWRSVAALSLTYPAGLLLATVICLPSYYYFALLGGARMTLAEVLAHSLKGKAATTVLLMGLLPIYAIVMLGVIAAHPPTEVLLAGGYFGLICPFIVGLRGVQSIYSGFTASVNAMTMKERRRRYSMPTWLVILWALLFTLTAPLALFKVWELFSGL